MLNDQMSYIYGSLDVLRIHVGEVPFMTSS